MWVVEYSGDANNSGFTLTCGVEQFTFSVTDDSTAPQNLAPLSREELITVGKNSPSLATEQDIKVLPNDSATLTGLTDDATGDVTFKLYRTDDPVNGCTAA